MFALIVLIIVVFLSLFLSYLIYKSNPLSDSHKLFGLFGLSIVFWSIIMYLSIHSDDLVSTLFFIRLSMLAGTVLAVAALIFAHTFPQERMKFPAWIKTLIYFFAPATMILSMTDHMFKSVEVVNGSISPEPSWGLLLFTFTSIGSVIVTVIILIRKFFKATQLDKTRYFFMILGIILMFALLVTTNFLTVVFWKDSSLIFLAPLYPLIFLIFTAYAIFRHKLLDIKMVLVRAISYFITVATLSLGLSILLLISTSMIINQTFDKTEIVWFVIFSFGFANLFQPLKKVFEKYTEKIFYRSVYDFSQVLHDLSNDIAENIVLEKLFTKIYIRMKDSLKVSRMKVFFFDEYLHSVTGAAKFSTIEHIDRNKLDKFLRILFSENRELVHIEEVETPEIKKLLHIIDFEVVIPLVINKKLIGVCLLSSKSSGENYTIRDLDLLRIIAPQLATGVQNALSYEEIRKFNVTLQEEVKQATQELRSANRKLSRTNRELKQLDELKDEFVSIASHELRTPMTAIKGYLWLALHKSPKPLPAVVRKNLQIAFDSNERLSKMVEDMLTISRIEGDRFELERSNFDVRQLIEEIYDELKIRAQEKQIALSIELGNKVLELYADRERIRECITNLVGNALKFTPEQGKVKVEAKSQAGKITISVSDNGPGIADKDKQKLFQKFSRLDHSYNKTKESGTGLGLYITKQILDLHHGELTVTSKLGKGSTFVITLPLATTEK